MSLALLPLALLLSPVMPGEEAVAPYDMRDSNAGAKPFAGTGMLEAFGGKAGIRRIVDRFVDLNFADPHVGEVFAGHDQIRFRRVLFEQFCYILNGGCTYTGRDMKAAHRDMGTQNADMNRVVENLQQAMAAERIPFAAQNRFLAKLAPMKRDVVER